LVTLAPVVAMVDSRAKTILMVVVTNPLEDLVDSRAKTIPMVVVTNPLEDLVVKRAKTIPLVDLVANQVANQVVNQVVNQVDLVAALAETTILMVDLVINLQALEANNKMTHMDLEISQADSEVHRDQAIITALEVSAVGKEVKNVVAEMMILMDLAAGWAEHQVVETMIPMADNKEVLMISMEALVALEALVDLVINMVAQGVMETITRCLNQINSVLLSVALIWENRASPKQRNTKANRREIGGITVEGPATTLVQTCRVHNAPK